MNFISLPSPNFDDRPSGNIIDTIILHYTDTQDAAAAVEILCNPLSKVSSHYLLNIDGAIYQLVEDDKRAWHAGKSFWKGREKVNDFSIGIEIQNYGFNHLMKRGGWPAYPFIQMKSLTNLLSHLQKKYAILSENIIGHSDIAPIRKIDPGPHFEWNFLEKNKI